MRTFSPYEGLCNQVTEEVLENVNHLARGTRNIIKTKDLTKIPSLLNKKNFTLTSDSHLAALFIKIIQCYVDTTFDNSENPDETKTEKLSKYIWQLQKGQFKESTKKKISTKFKSQCSKFFDLIEEPTKFENILIKAAKLTKKIKLDTDINNKLEQKRKDIDDIIAQAHDYTIDLSDTAKTLLSDILTKIKNTCKNTHTHTDLQNALKTILTKPETGHGGLHSPEWDRIRNEVNSLKHVNDNYGKADLDNTFKEQLTHCHKETIEQLLKTKERIVKAYRKINESNMTQAQTKDGESSSSSSASQAPKKLSGQQLPPKPESPPPAVPTADISDEPPPLKPANETETPPPLPPRSGKPLGRGAKKHIKSQQGKPKPPPALNVPTANGSNTKPQHNQHGNTGGKTPRATGPSRTPNRNANRARMPQTTENNT